MPTADFSTLELRRPREDFTKKLLKICARLDAKSQDRFPTLFLYENVHSIEVTIENLWVVGSYARGALLCGDLDLVLEYSSNPPWGLDEHKVVTRFLGSLPDVRGYAGTPNKNESHLTFLESKLIWSRGEFDWAGAISSIKPNPEAKRCPRKLDAIPLRMEQFMDADANHFEEMVGMRESGQLEWEVIPLTPELLQPLSESEETAVDVLIRRHTARFGQKSKILVSALQRLLRDRDPDGANAPVTSDDYATALEVGSRRLILGNLRLFAYDVGVGFAYSEIWLLPHLSKRGPNVVWIIRKGQKHPLAKAYSSSPAH